MTRPTIVTHSPAARRVNVIADATFASEVPARVARRISPAIKTRRTRLVEVLRLRVMLWNTSLPARFVRAVQM